MSYDPFVRGASPVGVRTTLLRDDARGGREMRMELWYPAHANHQGQDQNPDVCDRFTVAPGFPPETQRALRDAIPAPARLPLVLYFHGAFSHRRDATELCTHLASHGYLVAAPDFSGNTLADQLHDMILGDAAPKRVRTSDQIMDDRPLDAKFALDRALAGALADLPVAADPSRIGVCGMSYGGWTSLALNSIDARPRAVMPIVPAWGEGPVKTELLSERTRLDDWGRPVATLVLAAERDAMVMLSSLRGLHRDLAQPKRLVVLNNAGHAHFGDHAERSHETLRGLLLSNTLPGGDQADFAALAEASRPFSELCPEKHGADTVRSLCLAHMDANLKGDEAAKAFLCGDLKGAFAARSIAIDVA